MTFTAPPTFDVFISHSYRDREFAKNVADMLSSSGLQPFYDNFLPAGVEIGSVWEALAECQAFIVIVSTDTTFDAMKMIELGAAIAWNKPIFVLLDGPSSTPMPTTLGNYQVYPRNRLSDVIDRIHRSIEPISSSEREVLSNIYAELNVPADKLAQSPLELQKFVDIFNTRTNKQLSGTRVLSELLRMRKQSKLPSLGKKRASKSGKKSS